MKRQTAKKQNAQELIKKIALEIESATPTATQMIAELKMMQFKIRPLTGDLFDLTSVHTLPFLTSLWRIGKIEEVVRTAADTLEESELETLFDYVDSLQDKLDNGFGYDEKGSFVALANPTKLLKLEVFRDADIDRFVN